MNHFLIVGNGQEDAHCRKDSQALSTWPTKVAGRYLSPAFAAHITSAYSHPHEETWVTRAPFRTNSKMFERCFKIGVGVPRTRKRHAKDFAVQV
jgi:hypothetical protein